LNQKSNAYQVLSKIPDDRFFLETDDSGNSIEEIYAEAANIKRMSILEMKKIVFTNFENCFKTNL
jgi:TatD DNase family protein